MFKNFRFFRGSFLVTAAGFVAAYALVGPQALFIVAVLAVLEISLSFDNAVVNATVLKDMDEVWRKRFLTWGILIAVFGMRIVFPVIIVSIVASVTPWSALGIAINDPDQYAAVMASSHVSVMAFGGAFLMMVGLDFFFDDEKEHWIPIFEKPLAFLGKIKHSSGILSVIAILGFGFFILPAEDQLTFIYSGISGVIVFLLIHLFSSYMEEREKKRAATHAAKSGLSMFIYLEVLDASFSFDGVIGAFAISTNIFIIAIGLGIGAMFVRSLTILFVEKGTLDEYTYLEHGAFYAIVALATMMFLKTFMHVPEVITGLIGAGFIVVAFIHSVIEKRKIETT